MESETDKENCKSDRLFSKYRITSCMAEKSVLEEDEFESSFEPCLMTA